VRDLLNSFIELANTNEQFRQRLGDYERVSKSKQWQFVRDVLLTIKGTILDDMLSMKHTKLDPVEKDVRQRTYYQINILLDFLMEPSMWIKKKRKFLPTVRQGNTKPKGRT
jgi:hypothetical protein